MAAEPDWTADDAEALRAAVGRFVRAGRAHDEIPPAQSRVLGLLDRDGPATIAELADRSRIRHQSARATVALLHRDGLITTTRSADDARKVICTITAAGRTRLDADRRTRTAWILEAAQLRLTRAERAAALDIAKILDRLAGESPDEGPDHARDDSPRRRR